MKAETKVIVIDLEKEYLASAWDSKENLPINPLKIFHTKGQNVTDDKIKAIQDSVLVVKQELSQERRAVEARVKQITELLADEVVSIAEIMEQFEVSRRSIYQRVKKMKLHNILEGQNRGVLFLRSEVELHYKERQLYDLVQRVQRKE